MLQRLVDQGNTVVVIEHNLDVIKSPTGSSTSGPRAATRAARSSPTGTPEQLAALAVGTSYTGDFLRRVLDRRDAAVAAPRGDAGATAKRRRAGVA